MHLVGFTTEVERMLNGLLYRLIFTITKPCYKEIITECYALFEFHGTYITFMLQGIP